MVKLTLPTDSNERKEIPLASGCRDYFPAALAGVARWSKKGNDKHNPGEPLHHSRGKSSDHEECIERHSMDLADLQAALDRFRAPPGMTADEYSAERARIITCMLDELDARAWRALAASQEFREQHGLAPLAPRARLPKGLVTLAQPTYTDSPVSPPEGDDADVRETVEPARKSGRGIGSDCRLPCCVEFVDDPLDPAD